MPFIITFMYFMLILPGEILIFDTEEYIKSSGIREVKILG